MKLTRIRWAASSVICAIIALGTGVIVEDYQSAMIFGRTTSGVHDEEDDYAYPNRMACVAELDPGSVAEVSGTAGNFFEVLSAAFPEANGWSYQTAANPLGAGAIKVHTYDVQGTPARVGAEVHVEYVPGAGDPNTNIHWIQVVTNNHKIGAGGAHGVMDNKVDIPGSAVTPYYDDGFAADSGAAAAYDFYDFPGRIDARKDHTWDAVTFLVQGPAVGGGPGLITLLEPGFSWGWKNTCGEKPPPPGYWCSPQGPVTFASSSPIEPGAALQFSALLPASMTLTKHDITVEVSLLEANISVEIDSDVDAGGISALVVTGGGGQFDSYIFESQPIGTSTFVIQEGIGSILWEAGEIYVQMTVRVSSAGFPDIVAFATGTGLIDFENDVVNLDPGAIGLDLAGVNIPTLSEWGLIVMTLLALTAGTIVFARRRRPAVA